jgi:serine/threonine protein kinase
MEAVDITRMRAPQQATAITKLYEIDYSKCMAGTAGDSEKFKATHTATRGYRVVERLPLNKLDKKKFTEGLSKVENVRKANKQ